MSKVIVLDAGHGGTDPGAVNGTRYESGDVLALAKAVGKLLTAQGLAVVMTRTEDVYLSPNSRTVLANGSKADLFVSLHRNAYGDSTANGTEVWVYTTAGAIDEGAASAVLEQLALVGVQSNRGVKKGNYHLLRETTMPSMLVELGFITNTIDNQLFDKQFDEYARAIARGICLAVGVPFVDDAAAASAPLYKVQVGAFSVENNARAFLRNVRDMGLEAFLIVEEAALDQSL